MQFKVRKDPASILTYLVGALFALVPFFFLPIASVTVLQSKMILISLVLLAGCGLYGYLRYKDSAIEFARSPLAIPIFALPLVYAVSAILSGAQVHSFVSGTIEHDTVVAMVILAGVFFLSCITVRFAGSHVAFVRTLSIGTLALMIIQIVHVLFPAFLIGVFGAVAASAFGSWHEVGIIAGLSLFFVHALWGSSVFESHWRFVAGALVTTSVLMLLVVNMADVWFVSAALFVVYAGYLAYHDRRDSFRNIAIALAAAGTLFGCGFFAERIYQYMPPALQVLQIEVRPSWEGTFAIGRDSIDGTRAVFFGSGPNTFAQQWSLYKPVGVNATEFWNVDFKSGVGFIPTTFITVGIMGLAAWAALLGLLVFGFVRRVLSNPPAVPGPILTALYFGAVYLAVFHVLYTPTFSLSVLTFLLLGALVSAEGVYRWSFDIRQLSWIDRAGIGGFIAVVVIVVIACLWSVRAVISDVLVNQSSIAYAQGGNVQKSLSLVQKALLVYPSNDRAHRAAVEMGILRLGELAGAGASNQAVAALQVSLEATIQHGLAAVSINDRSYQNWLALASMYRSLAGAGVQGAYDNAKAAYAQAIADNPYNPTPLVQLAQLELSQEKPREALELLNTALSLKPDFAAAYFLRSQTYAALNNMDMAIADATQAAQRAPDDALSWYNLGAILYSAERHTEAAQALERSVTIQSNYANALYVLALTYDALGRQEEALRAMTTVVQLNPESVEARDFLARVQAREEGPQE